MSHQMSMTATIVCSWCHQPRDWMTTDEISKLLGIAQPQVRKACRSGRLPGTVQVPTLLHPKGEWRIPVSVVQAITQTGSADNDYIEDEGDD